MDLSECELNFTFTWPRDFAQDPNNPALSGDSGAHTKLHEDTFPVSLIREDSVPGERPGTV